MSRFQRWLDALPTTNWKTFWFIILAVATFSVDVVAVASILTWQMRNADKQLHVPPIVEYMHDSWLLFLAALGGISLGQFVAKRRTYASPSPDSERAGVPVEPAPTAATPAASPPEVG